MPEEAQALPHRVAALKATAPAARALERFPGYRIDRVDALPPWNDARAADADTDANARPPRGSLAVSQGEERPC